MSMINEAISAQLPDSSTKPQSGILHANDGLQKFKGVTFKFFGRDGIGLVVIFLFTFEELSKLSGNKTILTGTVSYGNKSISGDKIQIDLNEGTVMYRERGSRHRYPLEIDRRSQPQWDMLLEQLQKALNERI